LVLRCINDTIFRCYDVGGQYKPVEKRCQQIFSTVSFSFPPDFFRLQRRLHFLL